MSVKRMDNVLIVVDDLEAAKAFFVELGLKLEGETTVEGPLVGNLIGLKDVRATLAMMRTPDGQGIELDKFHTPDAIRFGPVDAPVNTLGIRRIMFAVDGLDALVARLRAHGAELIGEMRYGDAYRLAYIRGPEGIIVALAEQLGKGRCRGDTPPLEPTAAAVNFTCGRASHRRRRGRSTALRSAARGDANACLGVRLAADEL